MIDIVPPLPPGARYIDEAPPLPQGARMVESPAQVYERRVERYMPEARSNTESAFSRIPSPEIPIISPLGRAMGAGASAALGMGEGESFAERYANIQARDEAQRRAYLQQHPVASMAADVGSLAGSMAMMPSLGVTQGLSRAASQVAPGVVRSALQRVAPIAGGAAEGAVFGGASDLAEMKPGEGLEETGRRLREGATTGATWGAAVPAGFQAAGAGLGLAKSIARGISGALGPTERSVARAAAAAPPSSPGLSLDEYEAALRAGQNVTLADVKGVMPIVQSAVGRTESNQATQSLQQRLKDRHQERTQEARDVLEHSVVGGPIDASTVLRMSRDEARRVNAPAYTTAYSHPGAQHIWDNELHDLVNSRAGWRAVEEAMEGLGHRRPGAPPSNPFVVDQGIVNLRPNANLSLEFWDRVKRSLDDQISSLRASPGNASAAGDLSARVNRLRDILIDSTRTPNGTSLYSEALGGARRYFQADNAFDSGRKFLQAAVVGAQGPGIVPVQQMAHTFRTQFTPAEREHMRLGLISAIYENPDNASRIFQDGNRVTMNLYRQILGNRFNQVEDVLRINNISKNLQGISAVRPITDTASHVATAAFNVLTGGLTNPVQFVITHGGMAARNMLADSRSRNIIRLATSNDPADAERLIKIANQQPRVRSILRDLESLSANMSRGAAAEAGSEDRTQRASGGKVSSKYRDKASMLIQAAERAKKMHNATTELILNMPDATVAKALSIADKAI